MMWYYSIEKRWVIGFEDKLDTTEQKMGKKDGFMECLIMSETTESNFPTQKKIIWKYKVDHEWYSISNHRIDNESSDIEIEGT